MAEFKHSLIQAVREMIERNWNPIEIASKLRIDVDVIRNIINLLS